MINHTGRAGNQPNLRRVASNPNCWYPLAEARQVRRSKILGVSFAGEAIALARTETGKVFALEDRCAHRQSPLSKGVVCAGGEIQCGYHAWRYNDAGQITRTSQCAPGARPDRASRAYPCRDAYGLIFAFPGDPALAPRTPPPELPLFDSAELSSLVAGSPESAGPRLAPGRGSAGRGGRRTAPIFLQDDALSELDPSARANVLIERD